MEAPDFWNDVEHSNEVMKTVKSLKDILAAFDKVSGEYEDIAVLIEMADEEEDASLLPELEESMAQFKEDFESLRIQTLLSGEFDKDNAIVTLMLEPVEQRAATGRGCLCECIPDGQRRKDSLRRFWIISKGKKQA